MHSAVTQEVFTKPCVGAIIERMIDGEKHLLLQMRLKENGGETNGTLEIPAGKIREYERIDDALRREVFEETGLTVTRIVGGSNSGSAGDQTVTCHPYCITQNLSGAYSILLLTFLCEAEGEPLTATDESAHIHWAKASDVRRLLDAHPEQFFFMHHAALRQYLQL